MTNTSDEDKLDGNFGRRRGRSTRGGAVFPDVSVSGSGKRARAAWFNRTTGAGAVKLAAERPAGSQRVIVKARVVVHATAAAKGGGAGGLMRHALYVERDGAGRDGDRVQVFDRELDRADGAAFVDRCEADRHHFRVILSPERGGDLESMKTYTRDLMETVEADLGTRIDWIAAEHHDTGRPHVHLLVRGVRDDGRDLVIPRDYISHSFRHRAEEIATRELGPRLEHSLSDELDRRAERAAQLERLTHLDETLRERARDHEVRIGDLPDDPRLRGPLVQRLNRLENLGLAERNAPDLWRLDPEMEDRLTRLADARDRERATARLLAREDRGLEPARTRELEQAHSSQRVTGRMVGFEQMGDDARGPYLVGVESIDGKFWTARVARLEELRALNGVERGAVVSLHRAAPDLKPSDRTILDIAGEDRLYSAERHKALIPSDRDNYIQMHVRRLEALRREGVVERAPDGVFHLPADYSERVRRMEGRGGRESAKLEVLDPHSLEKQAVHRGPTWLDRMASGGEDKSQLRYEGFGEEARVAWLKREETLKALGLGYDAPHGFDTAPDWQRQLKRLERADLLQKIERDTGRVPHVARDGDRVEGIFTSRIHAAEKTYALILQERTATLAPWRPDMDRALNQFVSGRVNGRDFDFNYGREVEKSVSKSLSKGLGLDR
jgi:type IV secretory pathway VirD2 relaxase